MSGILVVDDHSSTPKITSGTSKINELSSTTMLTGVRYDMTTSGRLQTSELISAAETTTKLISTTKLTSTTKLMTLLSKITTVVIQKQTSTLETVGSDGGIHSAEPTTPTKTQHSKSSPTLRSTHHTFTSQSSHGTSTIDESKKRATLPTNNGTLNGET